MGLNDRQQFLLAASVAARTHDYFHWRVVGGKLGWPEARSKRALESLASVQPMIALNGQESRLLPEGRAFAEQIARHSVTHRQTTRGRGPEGRRVA